MARKWQHCVNATQNGNALSVWILLRNCTVPICQEDSGWRKRCWGRHTAAQDPAPDQLWAPDQVMTLCSSSWDDSTDFLAGLLVSPWWHTEHLVECHALVGVQCMEIMRLCVNPGNSCSSATDSIQQTGHRQGREPRVCSQARWTPYLHPSQSVTVLVLLSRLISIQVENIFHCCMRNRMDNKWMLSSSATCKVLPLFHFFSFFCARFWTQGLILYH